MLTCRQGCRHNLNLDGPRGPDCLLEQPPASRTELHARAETAWDTDTCLLVT